MSAVRTPRDAGRRRSRAGGVALVVLVAALSNAVVHPAPGHAAQSRSVSDVPIDACPANPGFTHAFVDPYWLNGKDVDQVVEMLEAGKQVGVGGVILQWSAYRGAASTVTAYPADPSLGLRLFNRSVPVLVDAAARADVELWMGLLVAPGVFSTRESLTDPVLLGGLARDTLAVADDLYRQFGESIDGWYLPIEPNYKTVTNPTVAVTHGRWIGGMTDHLHQRYPALPVMSSPSMPTAILDGKSAATFVRELEPVMREAGVDVWNFQDGYKMTAWSPTTVASALRAAEVQARGYGAEVWAVMYTPGPGEDGGSPITPSRLQEYMRAIGGTGIRLSQFTFTSYLDPDLTVRHGEIRAESYRVYRAYCAGE